MFRELSTEVLNKCVEDCKVAFGEDFENNRTLEIHMHYQMWSSTTCGFGGIGGCAMTLAPTIVIILEKTARVYHNGRFAYEKKVDAAFRKLIAKKSLPGARE